MRGKPCLGDIPPSGVFSEDRAEGAITLEEWIAHPRDRNERMIRGMRSSGYSSLDKKAREKTLAEISIGGTAKGPVSSQSSTSIYTCLTPRWPKWELLEDGAWKCRNISDWKASGGTTPSR